MAFAAATKKLTDGFTMFEMLVAAALSAVVMLQLIRVAVHIELELQRQQQRMALVIEADFITRQLRDAVHAAGRDQCPGYFVGKPVFQLIENGIKLLQCSRVHGDLQYGWVSYFWHNNKLYRKPSGVRSDMLANNILQFNASVIGGGKILFWLLLRSSKPLFHGAECYRYQGLTHCSNSGYATLAWPVMAHVGER